MKHTNPANRDHAPRSTKHTRPCPKCGEEMTFEPADPNYGADADGNRGRYIPASWACECGNNESFDRTDLEPEEIGDGKDDCENRKEGQG